MSSLIFLLFLLSTLVFFAFRSSALGEEFAIGAAGGAVPKKEPVPVSNPLDPGPDEIRPGPYEDHPENLLAGGDPALALAPGPDIDPGPDPKTLTPVQQACRATNFTSLCETSLTQSNRLTPDPTSMQIIQAAIWITNQDMKKAQNMIQAVLHSVPIDMNLTNAAQNCEEYLLNTEYRIKQTFETLARNRIKDARAYLSAAHSYQYDVWSALKYVNNSVIVGQTMAFTLNLIQLSSNALNILRAHDIYGEEMATWHSPKTEKNGVWETDAGFDLMPGFKGDGKPDPESDLMVPRIAFSEMKPDATVCKGGQCNFETVQAAVDAGPTNAKRFVILIKAGIYNEEVRVPLMKKNMVFLGEGMGITVITGDKAVAAAGVSTYNTATVGVKGDGFMASNLTIQNTAGAGAQQAVAFMSDSDHTVIENCEFLGNQDTLYAHSLRQFYRSCRIVGNVDFIFGYSASFFQDCTILIKPRILTPEKGESNSVTAHGRTDPGQSVGFVFQNCVINGTDDYMKLYFTNPIVHKNYLGRPWKEYSKTIFISCVLGPLMHPEGWLPWSGDQGLKTTYYAEFNSTGPGANITARVPWSNQVPPDHLHTFSVENFIQGNEWIPSPPNAPKAMPPSAPNAAPPTAPNVIPPNTGKPPTAPKAPKATPPTAPKAPKDTPPAAPKAPKDTPPAAPKAPKDTPPTAPKAPKDTPPTAPKPPKATPKPP